MNATNSSHTYFGKGQVAYVSGRSRAYLTQIVRLMELTHLRNVEVPEIKKAGGCSANYRGPEGWKVSSPLLTNVAKRWLAFHGLSIPIIQKHPFSESITDFTEYLTST